MKMFAPDMKIVERFKKEMRGVFTLPDLKGMFPSEHPNTLYRRIASLEREGVLLRFARGIYVTRPFDLSVVSQKLCPESYASFETVLAKNLMIGTVSNLAIRAVKVGKKREYISELGEVRHIGVARHLYFGFETVDGINFATKEKALLDTLYFHCKGMRFYFDLYSDIDLSNIDKAVIGEYMKLYRNPKFVNFAQKYLKERT